MVPSSGSRIVTLGGSSSGSSLVQAGPQRCEGGELGPGQPAAQLAPGSTLTDMPSHAGGGAQLPSPSWQGVMAPVQRPSIPARGLCSWTDSTRGQATPAP